MFSFISKNALLLALFAAVTTFFTASVVSLTHDRIKQNIIDSRLKSLHEVLPDHYFDNDLLVDQLTLSASALLGTKETSIAYLAMKNKQPSAIILSAVAPDGYNGKINLLIGITWQGVITGVRVVPPHSETPGLGDAIEIKKSNWITGFDGHSLSNTKELQWAVKKDGGEFDQFTGATITPRAVVKAVKNSLSYFQKEKQLIYKKYLNTHIQSINMDK